MSQVDPVTNGLEIYYITSNQHISTLTWNSTSANWHVSDISASIGAPAAALGGSLANIVHGSSPEVYYLGADQHIHQLFWNTVGGQPAWHTFDVSSATGATNASISNNTLAAMLDTVVGSPEVYYVGVDDDVHQLSWNSSTGWHAFNLTTLIGAPLASPFGSIMNFVDKTTNSPEAWYVGTDSHIHQDSWNSVSGWHTFDATAATNAAEAPLGGGISLLNDTLNSSPEVYYAGTDQHVHQLFWHPGAWQTFDISQSIGAANSEFGGATTSLVNTLTNALEVYYVSDDHHVWQLRWTSTTGWSKFDVSAFTGATAVTPRGALSSMLDSLTGSVEIYYVGWDQHVHQLTWNPTAGWHHFDISAMAI